ncbi:MAG: EAL domain-containing protein [Treponema sp.]|nr:EAL domain-containing protein [Treponema sp.]
MWNYDFVIPNSFILITFLFFYFSKPRLSIKINKAFLRLLIIELIVIATDVSSSLSLESYQHYPDFYLRFINVLFFSAFILRAFFFFRFTVDVLQKPLKKHLVTQSLKALLCILSLIIICLNLHWNLLFSITDSGYSRGPFYNLVYLNAFFYSILSLLNVLSSRKYISSEYFWSSLFFNIVLIVGYIVRIIFPQYLLMDSFCLLSIIICYFAFENPLRYLEPRTLNFNLKALYEMLYEKEGEKAPLIMGFGLHNYTELREIFSSVQMDEGISLIGQYLSKTWPKLTPFYIGGGMFVLIGNNPSQFEVIRTSIRERFTKPWNADDDVDIMLEVGFIQVSPSLTITDSELLVKGLVTALNNVEFVEDGNIVITEESIAIIEQNTDVKRAVERSIEKDEIELYLQPLVDAQTGSLVGAEALARIRDASGTIIPPGMFIPIAERNGRINLLGEQMFEKTCRFIKEHPLESLGLSWINVNLSPIQILRRDLNDRFTAILQKYDISADSIHLEITEAAMIDYVLLQKQIHLMKQTGFEFVLDDYGSGYSNVTRLKHCPFTNIKLDMELVWDYFKVKDKILPTMVQTFKQMGFTVTAEGIETKEMAEEMEKIGCDYLQGFYFERPVPAAEFAQKFSSQKQSF